jgi:hypothetical protein
LATKLSKENKTNMNIGLFYQSGYRYVAAYHALNQFRKFYPNAPVAMYEDNTDLLRPIARMFDCSYSRTLVNGFNDPSSGRPAFDLKSIISWFDRVHEACHTTLRNCEWIMNFEDDVWFVREVKRIPTYDLSGIGGVSLKRELLDYLGVPPSGIYGCGGSVFRRTKFIEAYKNIKSIDWENVNKLDSRPLEWTDSAITFLFMHSKFTYGQWEDASQYRNMNVPHLGDRAGWPGTMGELEEEQNNVAVVHCWKPFYWPTEDEILHVNNKIKLHA